MELGSSGSNAAMGSGASLGERQRRRRRRNPNQFSPLLAAGLLGGVSLVLWCVIWYGFDLLL